MVVVEINLRMVMSLMMPIVRLIRQGWVLEDCVGTLTCGCLDLHVECQMNHIERKTKGNYKLWELEFVLWILVYKTIIHENQTKGESKFL